MNNRKVLLGLLFGAAASAILLIFKIRITDVRWWLIIVSVAIAFSLIDSSEDVDDEE